MRTISSLLFVASLAGCGGETPAPHTEPPKVEPPKVEPPKVEPPKVEEPKKDLAAMTDDEKKAYLVKLGETVYKTGGNGGQACLTCHMENGQGVPSAFPPLVGQKGFMGDCAQHAGLVVHGYTGELKVNDVVYNGAMPPQPTLSDEEIAAVISYERTSWGNDYGICMPADVAAARTAPAPKLQ